MTEANKPSLSDADVRKASLFMSSLLLTPDDGLETFRERRVGNNELALDHLRRARDVLGHLYLALVSGGDDRLRRVERVWQLLGEGEPAGPAPPKLDLPAPPKVEVLPAPVRLELPPLAADPPAAVADAAYARFQKLMDVPVADATVAANPGKGGRHTMPFKAVRAAAPAPAGPDAAAQSGGTRDFSHVARPATPFDKPKAAEPELPAHLEAFTVEHYASLCVESALYPQWLGQVHSRYGIASEAERRALDEHWRKRLAADAALYAAWREHYQRYEQWAKDPR